LAGVAKLVMKDKAKKPELSGLFLPLFTFKEEELL
jgi:hypothetical protein